MATQAQADDGAGTGPLDEPSPPLLQEGTGSTAKPGDSHNPEIMVETAVDHISTSLHLDSRKDLEDGGPESWFQDNPTVRLLKDCKKQNKKVHKSDLLRTLNDTHNQRQAFAKLPFNCFFFMIYVTAMLEHENVADSAMVQRHLRGMLEGTTFEGVAYTSGHKTMEDIDTVEDIYTYLREVVIPYFIMPLNTSSSERHRVLRYNQIIGGVLLQQTRRERKNCMEEYPNVGPWTPETVDTGSRINPVLEYFSCYPWSTEATTCFGPDNQTVVDLLEGGWCPAEAVGEDSSRLLRRRRLDYVPQASGTGSDTKGARSSPTNEQYFNIYFHEYKGLDAAMEKLDLMQEYSWLDFNTAWMGFGVLVLNPDLDIFVFVQVHVYFAPSGALLPHITAQSFQPSPYASMSVLAYDFFWMMCLLWLTTTVVRKLWRAWRSGNGKFRAFFMHVWNWSDLLSIAVGIVCISLWVYLLSQLSDLGVTAMEVRNSEPAAGSTETADSYGELVAKLHAEVLSVNAYLRWWRFVLCLYTLVMFIRFLESFSAQPRLAMVTDTIIVAGSDLAHFLIIALIIFFAYCVAGMFLFGRRVWAFSSFFYTMITCWRIILGDFDFEELVEEDPLTSTLWFFTYVLLMMLIMLNMLMAIIMDHYTAVKSEALESKPIWTQIIELTKDTAQNMMGRDVSIIEVIRRIEEQCPEEVTKQHLIRAVPQLSEHEAQDLITAALDAVDSEISKGIGYVEMLRMIGWVNIAVQKIGWKMDCILKEETEYARRLREKHGSEMLELVDPTTGINESAMRKTEAAMKEVAEGFVTDASNKIKGLEDKMTKMEEFLHQALDYTTFRGKDLKNRLAVIEDLLKSQRDISTMGHKVQEWEQKAPARLGGATSGLEGRY